MKMRISVLVGILAISLPVVLLAQTTTTEYVGPKGVEGSSTNCPMSTSTMNTSDIDWTSTIICLQNKIIDLENAINILDYRVKVLESRQQLPVLTVPTTGCRYMENGKGMICSDGPKPVDGIDGVKIIQDFLKKEGSFTYPTATGYYGPITKEAVKQFQIKQGLTATGLIVKTTLQKMQTLAPAVAPSMSTYMQQVQVP